MSRDELNELLVSYGVAYTDTLTDRLMKEFSKLNKINALIADCDKSVEEQIKYGSAYGITCAKNACFEKICRIMKGD